MMCVQVRDFFVNAAELDLVAFYIANDRTSEAEAVLTVFSEEQKQRLDDGDPGYFRTHALWAALRHKQGVFGAAVEAYKQCLAMVQVRALFAAVLTCRHLSTDMLVCMHVSLTLPGPSSQTP
jgi:hypothetical protein